MYKIKLVRDWSFCQVSKTSAGQLPGGVPCGPRPAASDPSCPPRKPVRPCPCSDASSEASSSSGLPRPKLSDSGCSCPSPASPRWSPPSAPSSRSRYTWACTAAWSFPIRPAPAAGPARVSDAWIHAHPCPRISGQSAFSPAQLPSAALSVCLVRLVLLWETVHSECLMYTLADWARPLCCDGIPSVPHAAFSKAIYI